MPEGQLGAETTVIEIPPEETGGGNAAEPKETPTPYCQYDVHKVVEYVWWNDKQTIVIYCAVIDGRVHTYLSEKNFEEKYLLSEVDLQLPATNGVDECRVLRSFVATCTDDGSMAAIALLLVEDSTRGKVEIKQLHLYKRQGDDYELHDDGKALAETLGEFKVCSLLIEGSKLYIAGYFKDNASERESRHRPKIVSYDIPESKSRPIHALGTCLSAVSGYLGYDKLPSVPLPSITLRFETIDISLYRFYSSMQPCAIWRSSDVLVLFELAAGNVLFTTPATSDDVKVLWADRWHILLGHLDLGWNCVLLSVETGCLISSFKIPASQFDATGFYKCLVISESTDALLGKVLFLSKNSCSIWDMATGTEVLTLNDVDIPDARFLRQHSEGCLLQYLVLQPNFDLRSEPRNVVRPMEDNDKLLKVEYSASNTSTNDHSTTLAWPGDRAWNVETTKLVVNFLLFYDRELGAHRKLLVLKQAYVRSFKAGMLFAVADDVFFIAWDTANAKPAGSNSGGDYIFWVFKAGSRIDGFTLEFRRSNPRFLQGTIDLQDGTKISIPYSNYLSQDFCLATPLQFSKYNGDPSSGGSLQDKQFFDDSSSGSSLQDNQSFDDEPLILFPYLALKNTDLLGYNSLLRLSFEEPNPLTQLAAISVVYFSFDIMLPNRHNYPLAVEVGLIRLASLLKDTAFLEQYIRLCGSTASENAFGPTIANEVAGLVRVLPEVALTSPDIVALFLSLLSLSPVDQRSYQYEIFEKYVDNTGLSSILTRNSLVCFSFDMSTDRIWITMMGDYLAQREYLCQRFILPLHGICQYPPLSDTDRVYSWSKKGGTSLAKRFSRLIQKSAHFWVLNDEERSTYINLVMLDDDILLKAKAFDSLYFEALNAFKWDTFAGWRYHIILVAHVVFYILLWCLGSLHVATQTIFLQVDFSLIIAFTSIFLIQEIRQFCGEGTRYFSFYNAIDLGTYTLALSAAVQGVQLDSTSALNPINTSVYSFAVLCSWIQFLLHLRSIRWLRMALLIDSIYRIVASLVGFWIVLFVTTFAFAHALWTQSLTSNWLFDTFDNSTVGNISERVTGLNLTYTFLSVWYFIPGNYGGSEGIGSSAATNILTIMFLITVAIILMNVLIALINDSVNKSNITEEFQLRLQRARIIAHIELYWMLPHERKSPKKFPCELGFLASKEKVDKDREHWNEWTDEWTKKNKKSGSSSDKDARGQEPSEDKEDWSDVMQKIENALAADGRNGTDQVRTNAATEQATQPQSLLAPIERKFQELRELVDTSIQELRGLIDQLPAVANSSVASLPQNIRNPNA